jgi:LysR family transcriptional regulator, glycine cleavage system transcriptional activator
MATGPTRGPATRRKALKRRSLPPLDYLIAFEAAAECTSFAGASKRLNISETAISRKVRLLEQHFGLTFFRRGHRSIELTPQGLGFLGRIRPALDAIRDAADDALRISQDRPVTLAATNSVAALWLTPRLNAFRRASPHLKIMLVSSDNDEECLADSVDLTILRGDGKWPGYAADLLFGETVFPVCAPDFLRDNPQAGTVGGLPDCSLIEVASQHTEWMTWRDWLGHHGLSRVDLDQTTLFNTYPLAVQAAVDGLGVALGWGHLVDHLLEDGRLVRPLGPAQVRTTHGYYLLVPDDRVQSAGCHEVAEWLRQISAARRRYGDTAGAAPDAAVPDPRASD